MSCIRSTLRGLNLVPRFLMAKDVCKCVYRSETRVYLHVFVRDVYNVICNEDVVLEGTTMHLLYINL